MTWTACHLPPCCSCSCAAVGRDCAIHIPDRLTEGYGPSQQAVAALKDQGTELLVTLDCGVMAHDPLARAAELGMTTIIVDHHQASAELPRGPSR